ncbi:v-type proton ATPase subunit H [Trichonephila inaurata madagascariensis]|uniref:V-type proton ATPase subunit H n=1 Tax=Trichonephila inaurata madagascariensis TaxID=2747483 RepID=A0A8X7C943_9ARAC|nr:v-type proton ATPase subunit H [Trichonephila inaurata madagascariensis]
MALSPYFNMMTETKLPTQMSTTSSISGRAIGAGIMPGKKGSKTSIKKSVSRFFKRDTKDDSDTSKTDSKDDSGTSKTDSKEDSKASEEDSKDDSKSSEDGKKDHITKEEAETLSHLAALSGTIEQKVWGWGVAGTLWKEAREIRAKPPIDWLPYLENQFITQREFAFITAFQFAQTKDERDLTLAYFKDLSYKTIVKVVQCVCVVQEIEQFLVLIDDTLSEDLGKVLKFTEAVAEPWKAFYHLLRCSNEFVRNIASRIITKLIFGTKPVRPFATEVEFFLEWLKDEIEEYNSYLCSVARCLQRLLQVDDYRLAFMRLDGISKIMKILTCDLNPQAQYQFCFCLWVTTFNPQLTEKLNR